MNLFSLWHRPLASRLAVACSGVLLAGLAAFPAWAGDPFRTTNPRPIGDRTEAGFKRLFQEGNYRQAKQDLLSAEATESSDPLLHAMIASIGYVEGDKKNLSAYASKTLAAAQTLQPQDPVRGNLYIGVGHFLEGVAHYQNQDLFKAIDKLQLVFQFFEAAITLAPEDPEVNLIKGYLDLFLATYLPFSSPDRAIAHFQAQAAPDYLVQRGLAVVYRDRKQYDEAFNAVQQALTQAATNPEVLYLKGQILRQLSKRTENPREKLAFLQQAQTCFEQALLKSEQLPRSILRPIERDRNKTLNDIATLNGPASPPLPQ